MNGKFCKLFSGSTLSKQFIAFTTLFFALALLVLCLLARPANAAITPEEDATGVQPSITRLASEDSANTALDIAKQTYAGGKTSEWAVIARDDDFADAMSATGLAGALNAPIILADRQSGLSDSALQQIKALGARKAYIIGGSGAIPANIEEQLKTVDEMFASSRVSGENYWDTSLACASKIQQHAGSAASSDVIVAMGTNFQDALSISSFAYKYKLPIYLETDDLHGRNLTVTAQGAIKSTIGSSGTIYVPGGPGAVSEASVEDVFTGSNVQRIYGEDGFETSNEIALWMVEHNKLSASTVAIANGAEGPKGTDALAGAALAGQAGGVILLANINESCGTTSMATLEGSYVKDLQEKPAFFIEKQKDIKQAFVLGGTTVMPASIIDYAKIILWNYYKVVFNSNGGGEVNAQSVWKNSHAVKPEDPTREGFTFVGWYKDENLTEPFNFETDTITQTTTLYAKWQDFRPSIAEQTIEVSGSEGLIYTGSEQKPTVKVTSTEGVELSEGSDFTLEYKNNKNSGQATITIAGTGIYKGSVDKQFTIAKATIKALSLKTTSTTYNGSEQVPEVGIETDSGAKPTQNDCTLTYTKQDDPTFSGKPKAAGKYTVQASASENGNFTGTASATWEIEQLLATIKWEGTTFTYDGNSHAASASVSNKVEGDDVQVEVSGQQINAGQNYTAKATGLAGSAKANYKMPSAEQSTTFAINKATIKALVLESASTTYSGSEQAPKVASITTDTTATPSEGDYMLTYTKQNDTAFSGKPKGAGTYTVSISANEGTNFTGTATATWVIEKATPTVTFTSAGDSATNPVVVDKDSNSTTQGISNFISFTSASDASKLYPAYTVKNGDVDVEGVLTFTENEGSSFNNKFEDTKAKPYGVTFTPTGADSSNYNEVKGTNTTDPVTSPVIYVQVQKPSTYFLASASLLNSVSAATNNITDKNERALALAKEVKENALKSSTAVFVSQTQLRADVETMVAEQNNGKTAADAGTVLAKYKAYMNEANDEVHLYTAYGSNTSAWADAGNASGADANKYAEFRIVQVGQHVAGSSGVSSDDSVLTFHATHSLTSACNLIEPDSGADGWGSSALRAQLQEGGSFYDNFPSEFTSNINKTTKAYTTCNASHSVANSRDKFFLLSYSELCNSDSTYESHAPKASSEGVQYDYYKNKGVLGNAGNTLLASMYQTRAGASPLNSTAASWWLRSPHMHDTNSLFSVDANGNPSNNTSAWNAISVAPAFCFGADTTWATSGIDGKVTIKNPTDNTKYEVSVNYSTTEGAGSPLSNAKISFSESGELEVVSPNKNTDAMDFIVTVKTADATSSPKGGISVAVKSSTGSIIANGYTQAPTITSNYTGLALGQFRAHNSVSWSNEQTCGGCCECNKFSVKQGQCSVCAGKTVTQVTSIPKGHVGTDGTSALTNYGSGNVAKQCSQCGHVLFGSYEQDGSTSNGAEAIEWVKIGEESTDSSGNKTQKLMSLYGLDFVQWNKSIDDGNSWSGACNVRSWLNNTFYAVAFSISEQAKIVNTSLADVVTTDKVFLLSTSDVAELADAQKLCLPTTKALAQGSYDYGVNGECNWWLRSSANHANYALAVTYKGQVDSTGGLVYSPAYAVRPVLNVAL